MRDLINKLALMALGGAAVGTGAVLALADTPARDAVQAARAVIIGWL